MARSNVQICADIVESTVQRGVVDVDLYMEATNAGINVDAVMERAEDLYALATEEFEETVADD